MSRGLLRSLGAAVWAVIAFGGLNVAHGAVAYFTTTPNSDYATAGNWSTNAIPGNGNNDEPRIASGTPTTGSAIYSSSTNYTTTSRILIGHQAGHVGSLTLDPGAGTLSFGGNSYGAANYVGVDGGTGTLDVQAGTFQTTGGAYLRIGANGAGANGTLTIGGTGTVNAGVVVVARGSAVNTVTGAINMTGGTFNLSNLALADTGTGQGGGAGGTASLSVSGGTMTLSQWAFLGNSSVAGVPTTTFSLSGTGVINAGGDFAMGRFSNATATQTGGTLNIQGTRRLFLGAAATSTSIYSLSGGAINISSSSAEGLYMGVGGATSTFNLNGGGTLTTPQITANTGTETFNFNGGTLVANKDNAGFMTGLTAANVNAGGAIIDTNGFDITIAQALLDGGGGGLTKLGAGSLTLSGTNTYTGSTTVSQGLLKVTGSYTGATTGSRFYVNGGSMTFDMGAGSATFYGNGYGASPQIANGAYTALLTVDSGTLNVRTQDGAGTSYGSLLMGSNNAAANGTIVVNGGALNVDGRILMGANAGATPQATLTINDGQVNLGIPGSYTTAGDPACGVLWFGTGKSTVNLDGGTLAMFGTKNSGAAATSQFNFNGGTLQAVADNNTNFLNLGAMAAIVKAGGAKIDTNGFDVTIAPVLQHDTALGATPDGGLTKLGAGTLTLTGATSNYTGDVTISQGTLVANANNNVTNPAYSALGDPTVARNIVVAGNLTFATNNVLGNAASTPAAVLMVNGGTVTNNGNWFSSLGSVTLNGGTLTGIGGANATYQMWSLTGGVTVGGNAASTISGSGSNSGIHLGSTTSNIVTFDVADATGDANADLVVSALLINRNVGQGGGGGGVLKTGAGTMALTGANTYSGGTTVTGGTLLVNNTAGSGTGSGAVDVTAGSLGGTGAIAGLVTVSSTGILNPGSSPGTLTLDGGLSFTGGTFLVEVDGSGYDQVRLTGGSLSLGSGVADLSVTASGFTPTGNDFLWIINNETSQSPLAPTEIFNALPQGSAIDIAGRNFYIYYDADFDTGSFGLGVNSNDVLLTSVPEPSTVLMIAGLFTLALCVWRRRAG